MHISDMVMHVDNFLGENTRRNIEKALTAKKGIIHAHFNERRPHLMLVSYDTSVAVFFALNPLVNSDSRDCTTTASSSSE